MSSRSSSCGAEVTTQGTTPFDVLVRGGTVVTAKGSRQADVAVDAGGMIVAVEPRIAAGPADREVDASGLLVLPGVIDVHTHTRVASEAEPDRFFQDSVAAAFGGTTTFLSFNNPGTGISQAAQGRLRDGIDEWLGRTHGDSAIDYGLSAVITGQQEDPVADLPAALEAGIPTFKAFMVYDFGVDEATLRRLLAVTRDHGALLQVHCEDRAMLEAGIRGQLDQGHRAPAFHADSRPTACEGMGTARGLAIAREVGAPIYAVHVSCADALAPIAAARRAGEPVFAETCPHYLTLDASRYALPDEDTIRWVISPPLRERANIDAVWAALAGGTLDLVATDHVPDRLAMEKRYSGQPFSEISNGAPGIETLLAMVYGRGVAEGRITLERMVDLLSTTPARLFGLGRKGSVEVGSDADLVLFDPAAQRTLRADDLHHTSDYTPYEGMAVRGAVRDVFVRGQDVIRDGAFVGRRGFGRFQERQLPWS